MKILKKAAAMIAAASLAISLSACGKDVSWAAKIGKDTTVPIGMYIYTQASNFRTYAQNGMLNASTSLEKQTVKVSDSDKKATEYLDKEAVKTVKAYAGALLLAKEMKIELTDEETAQANSMKRTVSPRAPLLSITKISHFRASSSQPFTEWMVPSRFPTRS